MVSAQGKGRQGRTPGMSPPSLPAAETVTVTGSLIVANGSPALKSGDVTYIVGGISRLSGFIDGLKEGAQVTIEGRAITSPRDKTLKFLRPVKLTLNGKTYDMAPLLPPSGSNRSQLPVPRQQNRQYNRPNGQGRQGRPRTL